MTFASRRDRSEAARAPGRELLVGCAISLAVFLVVNQALRGFVDSVLRLLGHVTGR